MTTINISHPSIGTFIWEVPEDLEKILRDELVHKRIIAIVIGHLQSLIGILRVRNVSRAHALLSVVSMREMETIQRLMIIDDRLRIETPELEE
jgi:hypothetical protein